jgi:endonuclease YncB( thermonuclease family)
MKLRLIGIILALILVPIGTSFAQRNKGVVYDIIVTRVVDGDTVDIQALWLPDPLKKELSIRVYGVDTPEKGFRAKCPAEDVKGQAATVFTKSVINSSTKRQMVLMDWDKYGGRVLADILLDGKSLRAMLISQGYAREYYGDAKTSWCN